MKETDRRIGKLGKTAALKAGLYVIIQTGDTVKIDVPDGFTPKAW